MADITNVLQLIDSQQAKGVQANQARRGQLGATQAAGSEALRLHEKQADAQRILSESLLNAQLEAQNAGRQIASEVGGNVED